MLHTRDPLLPSMAIKPMVDTAYRRPVNAAGVPIGLSFMDHISVPSRNFLPTRYTSDVGVVPVQIVLFDQ